MERAWTTGNPVLDFVVVRYCVDTKSFVESASGDGVTVAKADNRNETSHLTWDDVYEWSRKRLAIAK